MRWGPPRLAFALRLRRTLRWRNAEQEFYQLPALVDRRRASIDVGAHRGLYAGRLAQLCPRVHCFEPIPELAAGLRRTLPRRVLVHELAVSDSAGTAMLRIPYRDTIEEFSTATIEAGNPLPGSASVRTVACEMARLDDVVKEPVGFMKIDVEGHELAVLRGAERILREDRPNLLIESERRHNPTAPESVFALLGGFGYAPMVLRDGGIVPLTGFDAARDQRPDDIGRNAYRYVNNFIFKPVA